MAEMVERAELCVDEQGRVMIPPTLLQALGIGPGESLIACALDDGRLVLQTREAIWASIHALFAHIPSDVSLVDERIAERREEARREEEEIAEEIREWEKRELTR